MALMDATLRVASVEVDSAMGYEGIVQVKSYLASTVYLYRR